MSSCRLDTLPIEVLDIVFSYFHAHEILNGLSNVSVHLDAAIAAYPLYDVNFKSIIKLDFDCICSRISPDQIISLTLCDDNDTPNQLGLFLDRFRIEQFYRLQKLRLINLDIILWLSILHHAEGLSDLHALSVENKEMITRANQGVLYLWEKIFSTFQNQIISMPLSRLRSLKLCYCRPDDFVFICSQASQLKSLDLYLNSVPIDENLSWAAPILTTLKLSISGKCISN